MIGLARADSVLEVSTSASLVVMAGSIRNNIFGYYIKIAKKKCGCAIAINKLSVKSGGSVINHCRRE